MEADAGLDRHPPALGIDGEDPVEPVEAELDPVGRRGGGEGVAGADRLDPLPGPMRGRHDLGDLVHRPPAYGARPAPIVGCRPSSTPRRTRHGHLRGRPRSVARMADALGDPRHLPPRLPRLVRLGGHGHRRASGEAPRPSRPSVQPGRAVPEGQPLPRPRVQPRPHPPPLAPRRAEGRRPLRAGHVGRRPEPRSPTRLHAVIAEHGPEAILPFSDAGNQSLLSIMGLDGRFFHHLGASRLVRAICGPTVGHGVRMTNGSGLGLDPMELQPQPADPAVGHQHPADQPSPVADHRGRACRGRQARRHRSDPHDDGRRRRRVRPTAAGHRHRPDAGDDARARSATAWSTPTGSPPTRSASTN